MVPVDTQKAFSQRLRMAWIQASAVQKTSKAVRDRRKATEKHLATCKRWVNAFQANASPSLLSFSVVGIWLYLVKVEPKSTILSSLTVGMAVAGIMEMLKPVIHLSHRERMILNTNSNEARRLMLNIQDYYYTHDDSVVDVRNVTEGFESRLRDLQNVAVKYSEKLHGPDTFPEISGSYPTPNNLNRATADSLLCEAKRHAQFWSDNYKRHWEKYSPDDEFALSVAPVVGGAIFCLMNALNMPMVAAASSSTLGMGLAAWASYKFEWTWRSAMYEKAFHKMQNLSDEVGKYMNQADNFSEEQKLASFKKFREDAQQVFNEINATYDREFAGELKRY